MKKFNYISILAGGSCKFNCDFCIGKDIRKNTTPHFSKKWQSFIECFGDMTDTLSVSGDTSDPSFVFETWQVPYYVKEVLKLDLRVTIHTRNIDFIHEHIETNLPNYDSYVLSIDEHFIDEIDSGEVKPEILNTLKNLGKNLRFSIVITNDNINIFDDYSFVKYLLQIFPDARMTIRPEVHLEDIKIKTFDKWGENTRMNNGSYKLDKNKNVWFWDYNETNPNMNVRYLFSNGNISSNCEWDKIKEL